jgi:hypothetical protein
MLASQHRAQVAINSLTMVIIIKEIEGPCNLIMMIVSLRI